MTSKLSFKIKPRPKAIREQPGYSYLCKSIDLLPTDRSKLNELGYEVQNRSDKTVWYRRKPKKMHFKPRRIVKKPVGRVQKFINFYKLMRRFSRTIAFKFLVVALSFATWVISIYLGITFAYAATSSVKVIPDGPVVMKVAFKNQAEPKVLSAVDIAPQAPQTVSEKILQKFGTFGQQMLVCMQSENGRLDPKAPFNWNNNGTQDYGLMRINSIHCAGHGLKQGPECQRFFEDIDNNINEAKRIFDGREYPFTAWYGKTCRQFWNIRVK